MNIKVNENYLKLKESYLFSEIGARVRAYSAANPDKKIVRLGIGDVTLPLAPVVIEAMHKATDEMSHKETFRGYAPEYGYDFIREKIAANYARFGVTLSADEVFASDGAKSDIGNIVDILGDNLIRIPDPVYPVYADSNIMSGRKIEYLSANRENGFLPMPDGLDDTPSVIYLCSPNNPTGAAYNASQLRQWVDYSLRTGSLIIYDSAYESFITEELPHSIYEIGGAEQCAVEICSLSKTAGFTGTRFGWTVVPAGLSVGQIKLNKLWARRQATKFNGVPYVVQRAAEAALSPEGLSQCREMISYYAKNASLIADYCRERDIFFTGGVNSPYIWLKCPGNMASWEYFDYLLNNVQVVGTPGAGFGANGEGYFRLTAFGSAEATEEAVRRMRKL